MLGTDELRCFKWAEFKGSEGAAKFSWVQEQAFLPIRHLDSGLHHV